jgi:hypothetical protein
LARGSSSTSATSTVVSPRLWQGARLQPWRHQPQPHQYFGKALAFNLSDINRSLANTSARALLQPWQHQPQFRQHFGKGLTFNLGDTNRTLVDTPARGSPSTSVTSTSTSKTSTAASPTA